MSRLKAKKRPGRPRNVDTHNAIIDATVEILGAQGYVDFTIEKVAAFAGVGKQTIYRWWSSKADLVLEVWRDRLLPPVPPYDESMPFTDYLKQTLLEFGQHIGRTDCRQAAMCVLAEAHRNPKLRTVMLETVYQPRITLITDAFRIAEAQGSFPAVPNVRLAIDQLYGAVWYKVLIPSEEVDAVFVASLVDQVVAGLSRRDS